MGHNAERVGCERRQTDGGDVMTTILHEENGALTIQVPRSVAEELHLNAGSLLEVFVEQERLVLQPRKSPYSLEQLLREQAEIQEELPVDRTWIDAPRIGRELI